MIVMLAHQVITVCLQVFHKFLINAQLASIVQVEINHLSRPYVQLVSTAQKLQHKSIHAAVLMTTKIKWDNLNANNVLLDFIALIRKE
jgi:hypothetical protein